MDARKVSRTAIDVSLMRSVHTRFDAHPLIDDPGGTRLVPPSEVVWLAGREFDTAHARDTFVPSALRVRPTYGMVVVRTRYAEDALEQAALRGARQYAIVGAGLDSFALR